MVCGEIGRSRKARGVEEWIAHEKDESDMQSKEDGGRRTVEQ